ncbi:TIGR04076 family protein [Alloscardovia macacae]|uniref:4Fe-4S ferredoxin n=1 Tax=Alloscardovia macacae TaxID=1160091 RepID=A0A261F5M7_9BIFI|nr:TIGR04076 family protein [Alloscardovia macacae]OZG54404.1 4Fe-4S ferredoxin [Alloscardovia macacae]
MNHTFHTFELSTLKVEVIETGRPFVCSHHVGDYFLVEGENLIFEQTRSFSLYALAALLPLLPAKQRPLQKADWMLSDSIIACPDPHCGAAFQITRITSRTFTHEETTVVPVAGVDEEELD